MSSVQRFVANDFSVRGAFVDATDAVQTMQSIQSSAPLATIGVGRAMVAALLMSSNLKDGHEVGILLRGDGPLNSLYGQANFNGKVRGFCPNPRYMSQESASLGQSLGKGQLTVTQHLPFQKQPHTGTVELVTGEVGDDIAFYLHQSHQIRSILRVGVHLGPDFRVAAAGGVLIEVMPGVEDDVIGIIEKNSEQLNSNPKNRLNEWLHNKTPVNDIMKMYLQGIPYTQLEHDQNIEYFCSCTKDRVEGALLTLGLAEIEEIARDKKQTEIMCQMCGREYIYEYSDILKIRDLLILKNKTPLS